MPVRYSVPGQGDDPPGDDAAICKVGEGYLASTIQLQRAGYQIRTRSVGSTKSFSLGWTSKASYQSSMFRTGPLTRYCRGECGSLTTCLRMASSRNLPRQ